eukprot:SAG31_NODE_117_length_24022_cov_6.878067_19_plen_283_part_00
MHAQSDVVGDNAATVTYSEFEEMVGRLAVLMMKEEDNGIVAGDGVMSDTDHPVRVLRQLLEKFFVTIMLPRLHGDRVRFGTLLRQCASDRHHHPFEDKALNGRRKVRLCITVLTVLRLWTGRPVQFHDPETPLHNLNSEVWLLSDCSSSDDFDNGFTSSSSEDVAANSGNPMWRQQQSRTKTVRAASRLVTMQSGKKTNKIKANRLSSRMTKVTRGASRLQDYAGKAASFREHMQTDGRLPIVPRNELRLHLSRQHDLGQVMPKETAQNLQTIEHMAEVVAK